MSGWLPGVVEKIGRIAFQHFKCATCGAMATAQEGQQPSPCSPHLVDRRRK